MASVRYTRNLFLRAMCVVYMFAFISFYIQIPGLYGDNGILPAKAVLENNKYKSWSAKVHYQPTLLWFTPYLGLNTQYALDVLALLGSFLAFTGFVSQKFCTFPLFAGLWSLYFSLYQVGQVFVTSQWDNLLLEAGFLSILVAPLLLGKRRGSKGSPSDNICLWLVRWLLFRFLLSSGLVKFLSGCPRWRDLSAFSYHFESMVIPSPLSWYCHHLPVWILRLTAVYANVCELVLPFLLFVPIRSVRITTYAFQIFLQICIVLTGNFNFVNILVTTLLLSLLDDRTFFGKRRFEEKKTYSVLGKVVNVAIYAVILYYIVILYDLKINGSQIDSKIAFSMDQFDNAVKQGLLVAVYFGLASLGLTIARAIAVAVSDSPATTSKVISLITTVFYAVLATIIFISSTVQVVSLHKATNSTVPQSLRNFQNRISKLHIVNKYGLFPKMTGIDGRPEIILEGSNNIEGPWQEYSFLYKPGNVNHSLPFVAPYAPRIDWQMWWAAQENYQSHPWFVSFVHRLLLGRPEVLALLDKNHSPFQDKPPKYIRATLYKYKYTSWSQRWQPMWWSRVKVGEYFSPSTKESPELIDYLKARNLLPIVDKETVNPIWKQILDGVRYVASHFEATLLLWSVFTAGCAIITTSAKGK
ncbi:lipase maturation factor 2 [Agrilus planipennis]|uniref:Lipase maturation factor n=1 Tax=Agrilus planipennis TaxID=224129 RepID=A0A1W4X1V9_AGRPL|nr:lipase maturation factor 2 [Agrilus planipennis]